jgi:HSP20 family protein
MYRTNSSRDLFADLSHFQRELNAAFAAATPGLRSAASDFPALNVGSTASAVEVEAFIPGVDPSGIILKLDRNQLSIEGERTLSTASLPEPSKRRIGERFEGRFRRVVQLPEDIDAESVSARCQDGVLHVSIGRREAPKPRQIEIH